MKRYCDAHHIPTVLLYGTSIRHADGRIHATVEELPRPFEEYADDRAVVQEIMNMSERYIRQTPEQYLWLYRRFRKRAVNPHGSSAANRFPCEFRLRIAGIGCYRRIVRVFAQKEAQMRNRRAIAFFLLCSVLLAIALAALSVGTRPAADVPRIKLSGFDLRAISSLGIERRNASDASAERISIVRVDGKWRIDAPISAVADENVVKSIIAEVVFAEPNDELSDADIASLGRSFQDFGLASPRFTVVLSDGGRQEICLFGRDTPAGDEVYVRLEGRGGVFTVARKIVDRLSLPLDELRQRQLFSFKAVDVVGISLKNAGEPLSKLAKADGAWRLVEPVDAPADKTASDGLVAALCSARVKEYASSKTGADAVLRLGDDEGYVILLRDSFGTVEKVVLGAPVGTNAVWTLTSEGAVAKIDASLRDICRSRECHPL